MKRKHGDPTEDSNKETSSKRRRSRSVSSSDEVTRFDEDLFPPRKRLPPTGHELDRINNHITLEHFGKQLQKAANTIFPGDGKKASRYTRFDVILLSWEDEDPKLPVSLEVDELASTFAGIYGYNVEKWLIPSEECHIRLQGKILQFLGDNDPAHLKIVYYAGHGRLTNHGQPAWTSLRNKGKERCPTIKWSGIQNTLEESRSDVLILLDCCASGVCTSDEGNGVTELIAACAYNAVANGVGRYSFTHALNAKLRQLSQLPCFNIGHLYNAIFSEVQSWKIEDSRFLKAPVHLLLSQNHDLPRSIRLSKTRPAGNLALANAPLLESDSKSMQAESVAPGPQESHPSSSSPVNVVSIMEQSASSEDLEPSSLPSLNTSLSQLSEYPRLLFSIRLSENVNPRDLSSELFADWLRSVPVSARLVTVEAGFASNSTITLVSVPAALLAYLATDPAILLLGTIWSRNLVNEHRGEKDATPSGTHVPAPSTSSMKMKRALAQGISVGIPRMATGIQSPMLRGQEGTEPQFSDLEKRFVLAEAIKKSTIPVEKLFSILMEYNVMPDWEHMLLPIGRDLSQCKHAFELQTRPLIQLHTPQPYPQTFLNPAPVFPGSSGKHQSVSMPSGPDTKKRKSGAETPTLSRDLLPKPVISSSRQMPTPTSPPETRQKKRGRPSKTDVERKQREAIERGDVIPPISVPSPPAGLQGQDDRPGVTPVMILPAPSARNPQHFVTPGYVLSPEMGVEHGPNPTMGGDAESSGKKRKPRPPPNPDNK